VKGEEHKPNFVRQFLNGYVFLYTFHQPLNNARVANHLEIQLHWHSAKLQSTKKKKEERKEKASKHVENVVPKENAIRISCTKRKKKKKQNEKESFGMMWIWVLPLVP
jgi:hypothetical protein